MRRLVALGLLFALAGCQNNSGSLGYRKPSRVDDPMLSIDEQQSRGRLRYSYVEDDRLAQDAALLLDRLVRQGRAFGLHVLLGSQTLGGAYTLARSTSKGVFPPAAP